MSDALPIPIAAVSTRVVAIVVAIAVLVVLFVTLSMRGRQRRRDETRHDLVGPTGSFDRKLAAGGEWGRIPIVEVVMRAPEVFVRSLSHQEAVRLKRMSTRAEHQATRIRAAILLAANVNTPVPQIARMWLTDESHVRKVIHEFNEGGSTVCALSIGAGDPAGSPMSSASVRWRWPVPAPTRKGCR